MEASRMRVCFNDDAPRIGSGWRIIIAKIGRKIVHVADQHGNRAKFSREVWKRIAATAIPMAEKRKRRRRKAVAS